MTDTKLFSMGKRRVRGDLIETYKIFNGLTNIDLHDVLYLNQNGLRTNGLKLRKDSFNKENYASFFNNRVVDAWNELPPQVVEAPSLSTFKKRLDDHMKDII